MSTEKRSTRGFAFIEVFVAILVLMTALTVGMVAFNQATVNRRAREHQNAAREAVALNLERLRALDSASFPKPGESLDLGVPPHLKSALPGATCVLKVSDGPAPGLVRAQVELAAPSLSKAEGGEMVLHLDDAREAVKK